jgi:hypothetical protein
MFSYINNKTIFSGGGLSFIRFEFFAWDFEPTPEKKEGLNV